MHVTAPGRLVAGEEELRVAFNNLNYTARIIVRLSLVACLSLLGCSDGKGNANSFFNEKLACPSPAVAEFEPWGRSGSQQVCKIKHGPFVAWEDNYIHVRGQFENGKEAGVWYWYDKNGNVEEKIDYGNQSSKTAKSN